MRPLYSATLGLIEFSGFLGAVFPAAISADLDSDGFGSAPAPVASSFAGVAVALPAALAAGLFEVVSDAVGAGAGTLLSFFC